MHHTDGHKLHDKTLEAHRIRAVQHVIDSESPEVVIKTSGMSRAGPNLCMAGCLS